MATRNCGAVAGHAPPPTLLLPQIRVKERRRRRSSQFRLLNSKREFGARAELLVIVRREVDDDGVRPFGNVPVGDLGLDPGRVLALDTDLGGEPAVRARVLRMVNFPRSSENKRWPSPVTGSPPKWAALSLRFFTATTIVTVDDCGVTMPHGHRAGLVILTVGEAVGWAGRASAVAEQTPTTAITTPTPTSREANGFRIVTQRYHHGFARTRGRRY